MTARTEALEVPEAQAAELATKAAAVLARLHAELAGGLGEVRAGQVALEVTAATLVHTHGPRGAAAALRAAADEIGGTAPLAN